MILIREIYRHIISQKKKILFVHIARQQEVQF